MEGGETRGLCTKFFEAVRIEFMEDWSRGGGDGIFGSWVFGINPACCCVILLC